jgi:hypothetical protein
MSHLTKGKTKIKDVSLLKEVAESMGLEIVESETMRGAYIGSINCEFVVRGKGGQLAVVKEGDSHRIAMDNFMNPICSVVGNDGALLTRNYQVELHKREAQLLGGVIANEHVDSQGYVYLEVNV